MNSNKKERIHFHTFDSLRFLAFLMVFVSHCSIPEDSFLKYFKHLGGIGVVFFFVLSGFLITYILLIEKVNVQTINLKNFFKRRILRIWPLFYAILLFAFATPYILAFFQIPFSNEGYTPNWIMSFLFLENYKVMMENNIPNVAPLIVMWTLCIEEHFYILWGILIYVISLKKIAHLAIISFVISIIFIIIYQKFDIDPRDILTNLCYFAAGAIPAIIFVFRENIILKLNEMPNIFSWLYVAFITVTVLLISNKILVFPKSINAVILSILFAGLILSTLGEKCGFRISDKTWIAHLGKYTYGLYLIHPIVIMLFIKLGDRFHWNWFLTICLSFILTIILAFISYHLFEKQFLKLKTKIK